VCVIREVLETRCSGTHGRTVTRRIQEEMQVDIFTFFLFRSDVLYCTGKGELAILRVCDGACRGPLATGVKCFLVYVYLFSVLTA
jgi:hypothetical protein